MTPGNSEKEYQDTDSIEFIDAATNLLMKPVNESREVWELASYAQEKQRAKKKYEKVKLEYTQCCSIIEYLYSGHKKTEIAEIMKLPYDRVLRLNRQIKTLLSPLI